MNCAKPCSVAFRLPLASAGVPLFGGNQNTFINASLINRPADIPECFQPSKAAFTLIKALANSLFEQFVGTSKTAAREFLLELLSKICRQR
ncbi:MAG TPA: hypothetical protein DEQ47_16260 [Solibacterales bacterium]|nr:hypothetical protein [Bryobacterales bacterium]